MGKFEVSSFYNVLISHVSFPFPWNSIWRTKAPLRVAFFVWLVALGKILTVGNLRKKNMVLVNRCRMCKKDEESIDHWLLHCEYAQFLWDAFFSRFGFAWVMPRGVVDLLHCWWLGGRSRSNVVWKMVPTVISLSDFLFSFLVSLRRFLVYVLCTRVAPFYAFSILHYISKKKKKKLHL